MMSKKTLVYRLGSLGDTAALLPAFHLVRRSFPDARITALTNLPVSQKAPALHAILGSSGLVDDYIVYPVGVRSLRVLFDIWSEIHRRKFDSLVYLAAPRGRAALLRDWMFFRLAGIRRMVGFPWRTSDRNCLPTAESYVESECDRALRCLRALGDIDTREEAWWDLRLSANERSAAETELAPLKGKPFFALSVGAKAPAKDWEDQNWRILLRELSRLYSDYAFVFIGTADEYRRSELLLQEASGRGLNLSGRTDPRISAALLERARMFIGHDSGPMHLAAAVGTPVVAIFAARTPPGQWFPRGRHRNRVIYHKTECFNCQQDNCVTEQKRCILSITVNEVLSAIASVLPQ